jgi:hypothetical protein
MPTDTSSCALALKAPGIQRKVAGSEKKESPTPSGPEKDRVAMKFDAG